MSSESFIVAVGGVTISPLLLQNVNSKAIAKMTLLEKYAEWD